MDEGEVEDAEGRPPRAGQRAAAELLTGNYLKVLVPSCAAPEREIASVRIDRVFPHSMEGHVEA